MTKHNFTTSAKDYPANKTIGELFKDQVSKTPDGVALTCGQQILSYQQLDVKSDQLAHYLSEQYQERTQQELRPGSLIALCLNGNLELVIGLLGVLKAGAASVVIDPDYPQERIDHILTDTKAEMVLCQRPLTQTSKVQFQADKLVYVHFSEDLYNKENTSGLPLRSAPADLAYVCYPADGTSMPTAVMTTHERLFNLLSWMDRTRAVTADERLLVVAPFSSDLSMLGMLWSLTKGIPVTLKGAYDTFSDARQFSNSGKPALDFSLFYFSSQQERARNKYSFLKESATYADRNDFSAIWLPERHFHEFGGIFPNPSLLAAAMATLTEKIEIRSGSIVLPLHDVIRAAEEWSVVDNLSNGRVALSIASGWHANDFVLKPENYRDRHNIMYKQIEALKNLWQGGSVKKVNGLNEEIDVRIYPGPVTRNLEIYITTSGSPETFINAGRIGANILTHLLGQSIGDLQKKIELYKQSLKDNGFSAKDAKIALMLHTYIGTDLAEVKNIVKEPLKSYLRSSVGLIQSLAKDLNINISHLTEVEFNDLLEFAFERYWRTAALLGTRDSCEKLLSSIYEIGVTEVACLVDFGIENEKVLKGLGHLNDLKNSYRGNRQPTHQRLRPITTMQITPSCLETLVNDVDARPFLRSLKQIVIAGENTSPALRQNLNSLTGAVIYDLSESAETTIVKAFQI